ncbi:MAG: LysR substrate-binding domain-containing protein [Pseudomonadota bacterium]
MTIHFRHHDSLRVFVDVARYPSFSEAAEALHMTKGAISYQIKLLEAQLGMALFVRGARGSTLTRAGKNLLALSESRYRDLESDLLALRGLSSETLTIGVSTYFAARWLSPRLTAFMQLHPGIVLRLQPMVRLFDLEQQGVDVAIRWGHGRWDDADILPFMPLPTYPMGNRAAFEAVQQGGARRALQRLTLLRDHDDSNAWTDWWSHAGWPARRRRDTLIILDPNVRVQAVIDGQGVALMDALVQSEIDAGALWVLSDTGLTDYGYWLARPRRTRHNVAADHFIAWMQAQTTVNAAV